RVILTALGLGRTDKLIGLVDDSADAALADARIFAARGTDAVDDDAGYGAHSGVALSAGFTLNEPRKQLTVGERHGHSSLCVLPALSRCCPNTYAKAALCYARKKALSF